MIEFRWVALITLWTMMIGPIFDLAPTPAKPRAERSAGALARR